MVDIPEWFRLKSDGASIPKIFKPLFQSEESKYTEPSILHDWLYYNKIGYFKSNWIFYKTMREYNVSKSTSILFFLAVTLFGWYRYYFKQRK